MVGVKFDFDVSFVRIFVNESGREDFYGFGYYIVVVVVVFLFFKGRFVERVEEEDVWLFGIIIKWVGWDGMGVVEVGCYRLGIEK